MATNSTDIGVPSTLGGLPDDLLGLIFSKLPKEDRKRLPFVSPRWNAAYTSSKQLWGHLRVNFSHADDIMAPAKAASLAAWRRHRMGVVHTLSIMIRLSLRVIAGLSSLLQQPMPQLRAVNIIVWFPLTGGTGATRDDVSQLEPISTHTQLTKLNICRLFPAITGCQQAQLAWIGTLQHLHHLSFDGFCVSLQSVAFVSSLTCLTRLALGICEAATPAFLSGIAASTTGLRSLKLMAPGNVNLAGITRLEHLTALEVRGGHDARSADVYGVLDQDCQTVATGLSKLPAMVSLKLAFLAGFDTQDLFACTHLTSLELTGDALFGCLAGSSLSPGDLPALQQLHINPNMGAGSLPDSIGYLSGLTLLHMLSNTDATVHVRLPPPVSGLTGLRQLAAIDIGLTEVPPCMSGLPCLQTLHLSGNPISALPDGPYLHHLEDLSLSSCSFKSMPHALAQATALTHLNMTWNSQLLLRVEDVDAVFCKLKRLKHLALAKQSAMSADSSYNLAMLFEQMLLQGGMAMGGGLAGAVIEAAMECAPLWDQGSLSALKALLRRCPWVEVQTEDDI